MCGESDIPALPTSSLLSPIHPIPISPHPSLPISSSPRPDPRFDVSSSQTQQQHRRHRTASSSPARSKRFKAASSAPHNDSPQHNRAAASTAAAAVLLTSPGLVPNPSTPPVLFRRAAIPPKMPIMHTIAILAHRLFSAFPHRHPDADVLTSALKELIMHVSLDHLRVEKATANVEYYPIWESEYFTMCVFVLRKGVTMPTHDHPNMTVFSKVVSGSLHIKTFEFVDKDPNSGNNVYDSLRNRVTKARQCDVHVDRVIHSHEPSSLLMIQPNSGPNMHSFTGATDSVVILDIIGPPYNDDRPCTYFREIDTDPTLTPPPSSSSPSPSPSPDEQQQQPPVPSDKKKKRRRRKAANGRSENTSSSTTRVRWLLEDPDVDYECTERRYRGAMVRAEDLKTSEGVATRDLLRLAGSVVQWAENGSVVSVVSGSSSPAGSPAGSRVQRVVGGIGETRTL
ncbi:hypothetical protein BJ742DRAFT_833265 [Cladochytrium replicatum]|nr:hypothetical protein BJ742DRAFT_833265 [Cladochytrium replicatum]